MLSFKLLLEKLSTDHEELTKAHDHNLMSPNEKKHLKKYVIDSFETNSDLFDGRVPPESKHLDSAISKYKVPKDLTVYSGTSIDPREKNNSKGILYHPGYLSSSLSRKFARQHALKHGGWGNHDSHIIKLKVPKEQKALYLGKSPGFLKDIDEKELLLPRGLKMRHIRTTSIPDSKTNGGINDYTGEKLMKHIHHMEIV